MSFTYHRDVLPNGLRVVTVETPHLHTALLAAKSSLSDPASALVAWDGLAGRASAAA